MTYELGVDGDDLLFNKSAVTRLEKELEASQRRATHLAVGGPPKHWAVGAAIREVEKIATALKDARKYLEVSRESAADFFIVE
jgi:hypothetical protein